MSTIEAYIISIRYFVVSRVEVRKETHLFMLYCVKKTRDPIQKKAEVRISSEPMRSITPFSNKLSKLFAPFDKRVHRNLVLMSCENCVVRRSEQFSLTL